MLAATGAEICSLPVEGNWGAQAAMNGPMGTVHFRTGDLISALTQHDFRSLNKYLMNSFPLLFPKSMEIKAVVPEFVLVEKRNRISPGI